MGNSEGDKRFEKLLRALGYAVLRVQNAAEGDDPSGRRLVDIRFKLDSDNRTSVLAVLKAVEGGESWVAFVGGVDLESTILAVGKALAGDALKWREDRPYKP